MFAVGRLLGNFGKISTFFRSFGKTLKRFRVIFALVRDADLESQIEIPNAGLIIGKGRDWGNENHVGEPGWAKANRSPPSGPVRDAAEPGIADETNAPN